MKSTGIDHSIREAPATRVCDEEDIGTLSVLPVLFICPPKTGLHLSGRLGDLKKEFFKIKIQPNYDGVEKKEDVDTFINNIIIDRI